MCFLMCKLENVHKKCFENKKKSFYSQSNLVYSLYDNVYMKIYITVHNNLGTIQ